MRQTKLDELFLEMVAKYRILFWLCLVGFGLFSGYAVFGDAPPLGRTISGVLALACLYGARAAPRGPWVRRSKGEFKGLGSHEDESVDPLAGDVDPASPATKQPGADEGVSLLAEDPEQPQELPPAQE
jgi:hypothetical protein